MKPLPAPTIPGKTDFERFDIAVRRVLTVPKTELLKWEERGKAKTRSEAAEEFLTGRSPCHDRIPA